MVAFIPKLLEFVDERTYQMIQLGHIRLSWTGYNSNQVHVFQAKAKMRGEIKADHVDTTDRVGLATPFVHVWVEPVDEQTKHEVQILAVLY